MNRFLRRSGRSSTCGISEEKQSPSGVTRPWMTTSTRAASSQGPVFAGSPADCWGDGIVSTPISTTPSELLPDSRRNLPHRCSAGVVDSEHGYRESRGTRIFGPDDVRLSAEVTLSMTVPDDRQIRRRSRVTPPRSSRSPSRSHGSVNPALA